MSCQPDDSAGSRFKCSSCDKTYSRLSHLRRHEATHSNLRRITCPACSKTFARLDIARRHMRNCVDDQSQITLPLAKRGRKPRACDRCSQNKLSCNLETPCSRCQLAGVACSYLRVDARAAATATASYGITPARTEFPWLLSMTNPQAIGTSEAMARELMEADFADEFWNAPTPPGLSRPRASLMADEDGFALGPVSWLIDLDLDMAPMDFGQDLHGIGFTAFQSDVLVSRLEEMMDHLAQAREKNRQVDPDLDEFDRQLARTIFTPQNMEHFLWVYFRRIHPYHPILHQPTFNCETVALPLLLALFLFGALFATPTDDAISARTFFPDAEEYIFGHPNMLRLLRRGPCASVTRNDVEIMQAALTIQVVQNSRNDAATRRRIRVERYPLVNACVRYAGLLEARHSMELSEYTSATWEQFIEEELKIRQVELAHWTQINNNFMIGCFVTHAQIYMCEMTGDLPCREELFDADTAEAFAQMVSLEPPGPRPLSLAKSLSLLLQDTWPGPNDDVYKRCTLENLEIMIGALGTETTLARTNCLFPLTSRGLLRACMRWKLLWDKVRKESGRVHLTGFTKYAMEMWWLCVIVIKVDQVGDLSTDYMSKVALDSFDGINEFLKRYSDLSSVR